METDDAGLYHIYITRPSNIPNNNTLEAVTDAPTLARDNQIPQLSWITKAFLNPTSGLLMAYQYSGTSQQSVTELQRLTTFVGDPLFRYADVLAFSHTQEAKNIDTYLQDKSNPFHKEHGWHRSSVKIRLPNEGTKWPSETDTPELEIPRVYHRLIINIIESVFTDDASASFNMIPYHEYWQCSPDRAIEVFSEAYSSPGMLKMYDEINALPHEAGDEYKCSIVSLMFWSDATHLANFGDASLWLFYLYFGNQLKYVRGKPTVSVCHHMAYIPTLPDDLQDQCMKIFSKPSSSEVYTYCKCELMQAIWALLLDEKFMHAYVHGIIIKCSDGITRRIFPRFFTYSANYPKKVILSGIKSLGQCPCLRCLTKKTEIPLMGTKCDMKLQIRRMRKDDWKHHQEVEDAWKLIFQLGVPVAGSCVKKILNDELLVLTRNSFLEKLCPHGFNCFWMFMVDELHEFELGAWKAILTHLFCILHAAGGHAIQKLNERIYCLKITIPWFWTSYLTWQLGMGSQNYASIPRTP
ncbi:hypothetical protein BDR05DRAFT_978477 [Suillus weaverae]|nr:hypothetical protein BDR05DRAFT_978477 [Suillus weaverae]